MKFFIFFIFSFSIFATTPVFNYYSTEYSTNIEFRYYSYNLSEFKDGDSINEISVTTGLKSDSFIYNFGVSKEINLEYTNKSNGNKELYHFYSSMGILIEAIKQINFLARLNFDFDTSVELNSSSDFGFTGILFELDNLQIRYSILYELMFGNVKNFDMKNPEAKIIKVNLQFPLYYFNLGLAYNYYLEESKRDYIIFININDIVESIF